MRKLCAALLLAAVLILSLCPPAGAEDFVPPGPGWEKKYQGEGFATFYRERPGKSVGEVAITGLMPFPPELCFSVVDRVADYPGFMPYMKHVKNLAAGADAQGYTEMIWFEYVCAPIVSCRFFTVKRTSMANAGGVPGQYRISWVLADPAQRLKPGDPKAGGDLNNASSAVEMTENSGFWEFSPAEEGAKTRVLYILSSDPGGSLPSFVINRSNTVALPKVWEAIRERIAARAEK